jgi:hypothetical protein
MQTSTLALAWNQEEGCWASPEGKSRIQNAVGGRLFVVVEEVLGGLAAFPIN